MLLFLDAILLVLNVFDLNLATIKDFFTLYSNFFYEIPKEGETNSHTFLIPVCNSLQLLLRIYFTDNYWLIMDANA